MAQRAKTLRERKERLRTAEIVLRLDQEYRGATCALHHESAFQLLVATILSAQCTDARVNKVTPVLFATYPTPAALAEADPERLQEIIRSTGFFRNKARSLIGAARGLVADFGGEVPRRMEELIGLPGVARKTANVVLGTAFEIPSGIVVDTHVARISQRLGMTEMKEASKIEGDLMEKVPKENWIDFSHQVIHHGRRICRARKPRCGSCVLADLCPYFHELRSA